MFKKAEASAQVLIISVAVGVLIVVGFYLMSKTMGDKYAGVSSNASSALKSATEELKKR